jgi:TolB-like protein
LFFLGRYIAPAKQSVSANVSAKSIAVLPFANLSEEKENAF